MPGLAIEGGGVVVMETDAGPHLVIRQPGVNIEIPLDHAQAMHLGRILTGEFTPVEEVRHGA